MAAITHASLGQKSLKNRAPLGRPPHPSGTPGEERLGLRGLRLQRGKAGLQEDTDEGRDVVTTAGRLPS